MKITCPKCQASLKVIDAEPGAVQTCPRCQARFLAPARTNSSAGPSTSPAPANADSEDWFDSPGPAPTPPQSPPPTAPPSATTSVAPKSNAPVASRPPASAPTRPPQPASPPPSAASPPPRPSTSSPAPAPRVPAAASATLPPLSPAATSPSPAPSPPTPADDGPLPIDLSDDDPLGTPPASSEDEPLTLAAESDLYRFSHSCPLCGTRMDFISSQIGSTTACPDCFTTFTIPPPAAHQERRLLSDDQFGTPERLNMEAPADHTKRLDSPDAMKQKADSLLEKAAKELAEEQRDKHEGQFSDSTAVSLFQFLIQPETILRFAALTLLGTIAFAMLANVPSAAADGSEGMKAAVWLLMSSPFLIGWFALLSAHALALIRETSSRLGPVESWPSANFFEWFGDIVQLGLALIVAGLPGFIVGSLFAAIGLGGLLVGLCVPLSIVVLLPLVLLSMLHEQSLFAVFSRDILAGITSFRSEVLTFYQASALLGIIYWMTLMATSLGTWLVALPQAAIMTLTTFLYFRLLGWLARALLNDET